MGSLGHLNWTVLVSGMKVDFTRYAYITNDLQSYPLHQG